MLNTSRLINLAAFIEAATGLALLTSPALVTKLLLDANPIGIASIVCRIAGVALVALAVVCFQHKVTTSSSRSGPVIGLFIYNLFTGLILAKVGLSSAEIGWLLWPAAITHLIFTALFIVVPRIERTEAVV
jgi:FtsH-binding integral membrane protein